MDQKRLHVGLITSFITMLIYLDQGHLTWTVVGVTDLDIIRSNKKINIFM